MNMIDLIEHYITAQRVIVRELEKRGVDLWSCNETDVLGWNCDSHGEHICCVNVKSGAQVEIPLLTASNTGIDAGHFRYYLQSIGVHPPSYPKIQEMLEKLEDDGILIKIQTNDVPIVLGITEKTR